MQVGPYILMPLVFLALIGCGRAPTIAPDFQKYADEFSRLMLSHGLGSGVSTSIEFNAPSGYAGFCYSDDHRIAIDRAYWETRNDDERRALIYHELGHCELGRSHEYSMMQVTATDGTLSGVTITVAKSIMNPDPNSAAEYFAFGLLPTYTDELFSK